MHVNLSSLFLINSIDRNNRMFLRENKNWIFTLFDIYVTYLIKEPPWTSYFCFAETLGIVGLMEQIMATSVDPLSFLRAVTRDGGFANDRRTIRARPRGAISRARTSHTPDDNGRFVRDLAFTDCQSGLCEKEREREREKKSQRELQIIVVHA